jgi:hypothetical protein
VVSGAICHVGDGGTVTAGVVDAVVSETADDNPDLSGGGTT